MKFKGIRGKNDRSWSDTQPSGVPKTASPRAAGRARVSRRLFPNTVKNSVFLFAYLSKYLQLAPAESKAAPPIVSSLAGCGEALDGEAVALDWKDGFYQLIFIRTMTTSLLWGKSYFNIKVCLTPPPPTRSPPSRCKLFIHKSRLPLSFQLCMHVCMYV